MEAINIEQNFLGHLLWISSSSKSTDAVMPVIERIEPRYFASEKHSMIYEGIVLSVSNYGKSPLIILAKTLESTGKLELCGGVEYIQQLVTSRNTTTDLSFLADELYQTGKKSELLKVLSGAITDVNKREKTYEEITADIEERMTQMRKHETDGRVDIPATMLSIIEKSRRVEKFGLFGYSWGIEKLDYLTGGIETGKSYVVGATKKSGKTRFVINTIHSLIRAKINTMFLSMEMGKDSVCTELAARFTETENTRFKAPLSQEIEEKTILVGNQINQYLNLDVSSFLTVAQIRRKINVAQKAGVRVVFIDYLQKMNFEHRGNGVNMATVIAQTSSRIADIAREMNVAIVFLSQLTNAADNQIGDISMLKDSGGIAEAVDCIIILNNEDRIKKIYDDSKKTNEISMHIDQRSGMSGVVKCRVELGKSIFTQIIEEDDCRRTELRKF